MDLVFEVIQKNLGDLLGFISDELVHFFYEVIRKNLGDFLGFIFKRFERIWGFACSGFFMFF